MKSVFMFQIKEGMKKGITISKLLRIWIKWRVKKEYWGQSKKEEQTCAFLDPKNKSDEGDFDNFSNV